MEDKVKIKVSVAGRIYPLRVTPDEEEFVRKAVDFIDERMKALEKQYAIKDVQDLQALLLIELASELFYLKNNTKNNHQLIIDKIDELIQL